MKVRNNEAKFRDANHHECEIGLCRTPTSRQRLYIHETGSGPYLTRSMARDLWPLIKRFAETGQLEEQAT